MFDELLWLISHFEYHWVDLIILIIIAHEIQHRFVASTLIFVVEITCVANAFAWALVIWKCCVRGNFPFWLWLCGSLAQNVLKAECSHWLVAGLVKFIMYLAAFASHLRQCNHSFDALSEYLSLLNFFGHFFIHFFGYHSWSRITSCQLFIKPLRYSAELSMN